MRTKYDDHSLYKMDPESSRPDVPITELEHSRSSPSPTVRNIQKQKCPRRTSPVIDHKKGGAISRTTRSQSEPGTKNKNTIPRSQWHKTKGKVAPEHNTTPSIQGSVMGQHSEYFSPPPSPLVDAFMVPYHRTSSATLCQMLDTPPQATEVSHQQPSKSDSRSRSKASVKVTSEPHSTNFLPLYRTVSTTLKDGTKSGLSPRKQKSGPEINKRQSKGKGTGSQNVKGARKEVSSSHDVNQQQRKKADAAHSEPTAKVRRFLHFPMLHTFTRKADLYHYAYQTLKYME